MPELILERLPPRSEWTSLPWNRRTRRRIQKAKEVILHLYSGPDAKFWEKELETADRVVLCINLELGEGQDVGKDSVMAYLMELCASGKSPGQPSPPPASSTAFLSTPSTASDASAPPAPTP